MTFEEMLNKLEALALEAELIQLNNIAIETGEAQWFQFVDVTIKVTDVCAILTAPRLDDPARTEQYVSFTAAKAAEKAVYAAFVS